MKYKKLISILLVVSFLVTSSSTALANTQSSSIDNSIAVTSYLDDSISIFENSLASQGTSVLDELEKGKNRTLLLLNNTSDIEEQKKIHTLIQSYENLIEKYQNYKSIDLLSPASLTANGADLTYFYASVAAVVAYFDSNGYVLSSELLLYSAEESDGSTYYPINKNIIKNTSLYNVLKTKPAGFKTSDLIFSGGSSTADVDAHYAINRCNISVNTATINITDTYDYDAEDYPWTSLAGVAISVMAYAQNAGVIVPYPVSITISK